MTDKALFAVHDDQNSILRRSPNSNKQDSFQSLIKAISDALGPSSGIDSDDVDANEIQEIMARYKSQEDEWSQYALSDPNRPYTRNLVDEGNGKSNLLVLVWGPGRQSPVHDHANAHCIMKILKGSLVETMYETPVDDKVWSERSEKTNHPLDQKASKTYNENEVAYINDKMGLHRISNPSKYVHAVSLHLYTPPYAAKFGFNVFDERTSARSHCKQGGFFSCRGQKL